MKKYRFYVRNLCSHEEHDFVVEAKDCTHAWSKAFQRKSVQALLREFRNDTVTYNLYRI